MTLIKNFPIPSDRMAIISTLLYIKDAVVLEYGPEGTTHFSMNFYNQLGQKYVNRLFTTGIDDNDIVMGDVTRLEEAILEIDALYKPKVIFVITSSVISIIGTDVTGICDNIQNKVQAKLISINCSGLSADFSAGLTKIYLTLAEEFLQPATPKKKNKYNILGVSLLNFRAESDVWELQNLLSEAFDYEMLHCLALDINTHDISELGSAEINIVLSAEGVPCAEYIKKVTGVPYVYFIPYGYADTTEFLKRIEELIQKPVAETLKNRLSEKQRQQQLFFNSPILAKVGKKIFIKGNYDIAIGLQKYFQSNNLPVEFCLCNHSLSRVMNKEKITHLKNEQEYLDILKHLHGYLVLSDEITLSQCGTDNFKLCISHPTISFKNIATHLPFIGEKGADMLFEQLQQYLSLRLSDG